MRHRIDRWDSQSRQEPHRGDETARENLPVSLGEFRQESHEQFPVFPGVGTEVLRLESDEGIRPLIGRGYGSPRGGGPSCDPGGSRPGTGGLESPAEKRGDHLLQYPSSSLLGQLALHRIHARILGVSGEVRGECEQACHCRYRGRGLQGR